MFLARSTKDAEKTVQNILTVSVSQMFMKNGEDLDDENEHFAKSKKTIKPKTRRRRPLSKF